MVLRIKLKLQKNSCFCIELGINSRYRLEKFLLTRPDVELLVSYSHNQEFCYDLTVQTSYSFSTHSGIYVTGDTTKRSVAEYVEFQKKE